MTRTSYLSELARWYWRTTRHKYDVAVPMLGFAACLVWRAIVHDLSKYRWRETKWYVRTNAAMRVTPGGTPEYKALCDAIKPGIDEHYRANSHHPEHFPDGIKGMSFADEIEMVFDWVAASKRAPKGNAFAWVLESRKRFRHSRDRARFYTKGVEWITRRKGAPRG